MGEGAGREPRRSMDEGSQAVTHHLVHGKRGACADLGLMG